VEAWEKIRHFLKLLSEDSKVGAQTFVLYLSSLTSLALSNDSPVSELARSGLNTISVFSTLKYSEKNQRNLFFSDGHYNQKAHEVIAQALAMFLTGRPELNLVLNDHRESK
jgi:hypothetical protein